jgi:hypothetical protein
MPLLSSLAADGFRQDNSVMQPPAQRLAAPAVTEIPLRPQDELECRRCEVHCDKVVYPSACVDRACPFLYAVEEFGHTYIGCMQRVYGVEIDLELLRAAEVRREGFGGMRTTRAPLPMCRVEVEECYGSDRSGDLGCVNPEFHELPVGKPTFKVFAQLTD